MPASGPVYQPTTVSYEQHGDWPPRTGYLSQTVGSGFTRTQCLQWLVLVLGLFAVAAGLLMAVEGTLDYHATENVEGLKQETSGDLIIAVSGLLLLLIGCILLAGYISILRNRRGCLCFPSKEQRLSRQLRDGPGVHGQILTLGPSSTDMLVTAQYGPVSEISYQPPAIVDEEETRQLMDHKERRIHSLMPAPLATCEDITPSLRSSSASIYLTMSGSDSSFSMHTACSE